MSYPNVIIKNKRVDAIKRRHPWIFSGAIHSKPSNLKDGDVVCVIDNQENHLATGQYHNGSIMVRVLTFEDVLIDQKFWNAKINKAYTYRSTLQLTKNDNTNAYRLIHGEGDGMSGLIIDIYDLHAVVQCHSIGMYRSIDMIIAALEHVYEGSLKAIYVKSGNSLPSSYDAYPGDYFAKGDAEQAVIIENGVKFQINWVKGQKTGFFLDQRENRKLLGAMSSVKSVLNCFCYTGGFSMYAMANNAEKVHSVDVSAYAMELVEENYKLNDFKIDHQTEAKNVMTMFSDESLSKYDIVIVDPPAFAKSVKKRHNAVQAYKRLNIMALKNVKKGGFLFTFSCSQVVDTALFNNTIRSAAIESGKEIQVVKYLSQGPDHPVNIYHPEGSYLKGLVLKVG